MEDVSKMSGDEMVEKFEAGTFPPEMFHHGQHVRMAFHYLQRWPLLEALQRFSTALKRFATAAGKPERYHETVTWAFVFVIHERMEEDWEAFRERNNDLMGWPDNYVMRMYGEGILKDEKARERFRLPVTPPTPPKPKSTSTSAAHGYAGSGGDI